MPYKHQANCYRNFGGIHFINYADLICGEKENDKIVAEARKIYKKIKKLKHSKGYYQLFVAIPKQ